MKLIVGLGNPGKEYEHTRHNIGFLMADHLANAWNVGFKEKPKFKAFIAESSHTGEKVLLVKPATFYNLSGEAVRAIRDFYKLQSTDILAIHDDMALPFGTIRTRLKGSDAGNNGVKSLNAHLDDDFARIRIGIWNDLREKAGAVDFVLGKFSSDEKNALTAISRQTERFVENFIKNEFEPTKVMISKE